VAPRLSITSFLRKPLSIKVTCLEGLRLLVQANVLEEVASMLMRKEIADATALVLLLAPPTKFVIPIAHALALQRIAMVDSRILTVLATALAILAPLRRFKIQTLVLALAPTTTVDVELSNPPALAVAIVLSAPLAQDRTMYLDPLVNATAHSLTLSARANMDQSGLGILDQAYVVVHAAHRLSTPALLKERTIV
jgi:hypothetical protein